MSKKNSALLQTDLLSLQLQDYNILGYVLMFASFGSPGLKMAQYRNFVGESGKQHN